MIRWNIDKNRVMSTIPLQYVINLWFRQFVDRWIFFYTSITVILVSVKWVGARLLLTYHSIYKTNSVIEYQATIVWFSLWYTITINEKNKRYNDQPHQIKFNSAVIFDKKKTHFCQGICFLIEMVLCFSKSLFKVTCSKYDRYDDLCWWWCINQ